MEKYFLFRIHNGVGLVELPQNEKLPKKTSEAQTSAICEAVGA